MVPLALDSWLLDFTSGLPSLLFFCFVFLFCFFAFYWPILAIKFTLCSTEILFPFSKETSKNRTLLKKFLIFV